MGAHCAGAHCLDGIEDCRQRAIVDSYQTCGFEGCVPILRSDGHDGFAHIAHTIYREVQSCGFYRGRAIESYEGDMMRIAYLINE